MIPAGLVGATRPSVNHVLQGLASRGLVALGRGRITVLDRPKLEARVCECYAVVKREYDRLLPEGVLESTYLSPAGSFR